MNKSQYTGTALPTGTVTFLFTDIQGSTSLWERAPEKMAEDLQIHNHALHQAIEVHGGVVFKTIGDAFQAAFATAPQALKAAIEGQRALQAAPWNELGPLKVRMGLHTGEAELDPGGDEYAVSHTKNRVARIMSAGHGGQILLSQETADLVQRVLPEGVTLKDLGEHRLKGMENLERLFQATAPGLPREFPPLFTTVIRPNNLPVKLTSFIGREKELASITRLLAGHRLVTLTGSGGTGKTRLSLQVASQLLETYPNGAWLVELASLTDPALVPQTLASALNLPELPGKPILDSLVDFLRNKRLLLILDNCEHLLEACASLVDHLLQACPELTILASSREFLGVEGEAPYRVPPMVLPDPRHLPTLEAISEFDAVRLFVERAQVVSPDFTINESHAATLVQVVNRLDGIPLAIELAAARLRLLGMDQLLQRLNDTFRLLTGGSRSKLPRHQTLRASIDWSYNLLSEPERILLRRLSVFAGGCRLQAAEQVCADDADSDLSIGSEYVLDLLSELVDKSLVIADNVSEGRMRYRMLETIRQYAHEKLVDEGESAAARTRHLDYYLELVEELEPKIRGREQIETLDLLELDLDNLRLAMEWALQTDIVAELRLASALKWFWHIYYHWSEGIDWLERGVDAQAIPPAPAPEADPHRIARARALEALGFQCKMQFTQMRKPDRLVQSRKVLEESVSIFRSCDLEQRPELKPRLAWALKWLGSASNFEGDLPQQQLLTQQALSLFREAADAHGTAECLYALANLEIDQVRRKNLLLEALALDNANGDVEGIATAHQQIGWSEIINGDYAQAYASFEASLLYYQRVRNINMIGWCWLGLGSTSLFMGNPLDARQHLERSLALYNEYGVDGSELTTLFWMIALEIAEGRFDQAAEISEEMWCTAQKAGSQPYEMYTRYMRARLARLQGNPDLAASHLSVKQGAPIPEREQAALFRLEEGYLALESGDLGRAGKLWREGFQILLQMKNIVWLFLLLDAMAVLAVQEGKLERAICLYGTRWSRGYFYALSPGERTQRQVDLDRLRAALGEARFNELYVEGGNMTLEQVVRLALEEEDE